MSDEQTNDPVGWDEALGEHAANPAQPRQTGEHLFALGQEWMISPDEGRIKAQFESAIKKGAERAISETMQSGDIEEADRQRAVYLAARGAGAYTWDGKACRAARGDFPGIVTLLFLMLRRCHPGVTEATARAIARENWAGVLATVAAALGNWESPAKKEQPTPRQPPLTKQEVANGSAWTGEKTKKTPFAPIRPATPLISEAATKAQQYSDEDLRRAMEYLATQAPATVGDPSEV